MLLHQVLLRMIMEHLDHGNLPWTWLETLFFFLRGTHVDHGLGFDVSELNNANVFK